MSRPRDDFGLAGATATPRNATTDPEGTWRALAVLDAMLRGPLPASEVHRLAWAIGGDAAFLGALDVVDLYLADAGGDALFAETQAMRRRLSVQVVRTEDMAKDGPLPSVR